MRDIKGLFNEFIKDESGLTAVEYAIAGGLVVGSMVLAFTTLGTAATNGIDDLTDAVNGGTTTTNSTGG